MWLLGFMIFVSNTLAKCSLVICKANQRKVWASGSVLLHRVFGLVCENDTGCVTFV